ncbi:hypothetical protein [Pseudohaliea rubra]|uniref:Uncharacterized protein n=1 Tax=Pseudohaliea rubra DSM 19751 TaxID=1265313 RepID=A0A095WVJ8_9GAMM|nr:hypothetical protein [Pseudohaliea rubra]KGE02669.1 hypothetical protein HRUBRA_02647 [Pseudohaliea rubra DSM 19751]
MHSFSVDRVAIHHGDKWQPPFTTPAALFAGFDPSHFESVRHELPAATYPASNDRLLVPLRFGGCPYASIDRDRDQHHPRYDAARQQGETA